MGIFAAKTPEPTKGLKMQKRWSRKEVCRTKRSGGRRTEERRGVDDDGAADGAQMFRAWAEERRTERSSFEQQKTGNKGQEQRALRTATERED
jgi:hypothetical protein